MTSSTVSDVWHLPAYKYARDVICGKIKAGVKVKQSCQRFINDLANSKKATYRWRFDIQKAERPIEFMELFLVPSKGDYEKLLLLPWQKFCESNIYGWVDKKTDIRRFREALIIVGAGNGKSTMISGNAIYGACKDGERGADIYLLANSKDQAGIIYSECSTQIRSSPLLDKHFRVRREAIYYDETESSIKRLASDAKTLQGLNVHIGVFDELQEYVDYKLINTIKAKCKKRRQPLIIYITTLGNVIDGPLMDYYILGESILNGDKAINPEVADRMFIFIAEIDKEDDPDDESCYIKANPSLGVLLKPEDLHYEWERVKLIPAERADFINKQLNVFTSIDELSFLDAPTVLANNRLRHDIELLRGRSCYGGYDLAETDDFTSACLEFPLENGLFFYLLHSWVPLKKVKLDAEKLDWDSLSKSGHLTIVNTPHIEYMTVFYWFKKMSEIYKIQCIGYDPAKAHWLNNELQKDGFVTDPVRQGELTFSAPMQDLKERYLDEKIITNGDPMHEWYLRNVKLAKRSQNATYLPTKQNSRRKIDGFMAELDAHTVYMRNATKNTINHDSEIVRIIDLEA